MLNNIFFVKHLVIPRNRRTFEIAKKKYRGVEQLVARQAHNLEVARSSRAPATKKKPCGFFFCALDPTLVLMCKKTTAYYSEIGNSDFTK